VQTLFGFEEKKEESAKEYEFVPNCPLTFIRDFMETYHYSRSAEVSAMYCFALVSKRIGVVAAMIFSKPAMNSIFKLYADKEEDVLELRRLVAIDDTPKNTESYFLGKALRWLVLNTDKKTVVTYADPTFGHVGHAYRACNFVYDGLSGSTQVLEIPIEQCVHSGRCKAEGKPFCQVHDRNMRCKTDSGEFTQAALLLRKMHEDGVAKLVHREPKHRYHYHLESLRTKKAQTCRMCDELKTGQVKLPTVEKPVIKQEIKEHIEMRIAEGKAKPTQDKKAILEKIEKGWTKDTSYWPDRWSSENPACGQCAITALIVQENLGGDLLRTEVEGFGSHYYNKLPDGTIVDLTKKQFPSDAKMSAPSVKKRQDILQYKKVEKRYVALKENIEKAN